MEDDFISDDPGTILDSYASVPLAIPPGPAVSQPSVARPTPPPIAADEIAYRSPYRWSAPRVIICDDGSLEQGETFYVRSDKLVIGRTQGDIIIGHDIAMSGGHAEIARRDFRGKHEWVLRDLGSSNGTLARVRAVTLKPGTTIMLGSKRYRFEPSTLGLPQPAPHGEPGTALLTDLRNVAVDAFPALVENVLPGAGPTTRYPFRTHLVTVGRPGHGNGIELDDPCVAKYHAVITRDLSGVWQLEAQPSLNGVWVKVDSIRLTDNCSFQCGEQRFRFRL
jgi:pSer/pThr/pTyr-binding forkhead associated (FHA) protein